MWLQNILTISNHIFFWGGFWYRGEVGGWNSRSTVVQLQKPLLQCFSMLSLGWSSCRNFSRWSEIAGNDRCDFPLTRSDGECGISCFWESCVSKCWKKEKHLVSFSDKKVGKIGGLLKILRVPWYFYFATHVQFLVGSLTKQIADMERVSHRILSLLTKRTRPDQNIYQIWIKTI